MSLNKIDFEILKTSTVRAYIKNTTDMPNLEEIVALDSYEFDSDVI